MQIFNMNNNNVGVKPWTFSDGKLSNDWRSQEPLLRSGGAGKLGRKAKPPGGGGEREALQCRVQKYCSLRRVWLQTPMYEAVLILAI